MKRPRFMPRERCRLRNQNLLARFQRASVKRVAMTPGIASLNPGLMSVQPFRAAGFHAGGVNGNQPGERSVASHRGLASLWRNARRRRARRKQRFSNSLPLRREAWNPYPVLVCAQTSFARRKIIRSLSPEP